MTDSGPWECLNLHPTTWRNPNKSITRTFCVLLSTLKKKFYMFDRKALKQLNICKGTWSKGYEDQEFCIQKSVSRTHNYVSMGPSISDINTKAKTEPKI